MRTLKTAFAALLVAAIPTTAFAGGADWVADFDEAVAIAKKENKDLLVDFTGSDWCGWCIKLDEEVFSHGEFLTPARENFVLVALDFPRAEEIRAKVPNPERNAALQKKYAIQGFPTILLMTSTGEVYGRTGYRPGGPAKYIEHLDEFRNVGRKKLFEAKDMVVAFAKAEGAEKEAQREKILMTLEGLSADSVAAAVLVEPVRGYLTLDPENASGHKLRAVKAIMMVEQADEEIYVAARALDPKNEAGLYELVVMAVVDAVDSEEAVKGAIEEIDALVAMGKIHDEANARGLYIRAADWSKRFLKDTAKAKEYAAMARKLAGDDTKLIEFLDSILNS